MASVTLSGAALPRHVDRRRDAAEALLRALARSLWIAPVVLALVVTLAYPIVFLVALALSKSTLGKPFQTFAGLGPLLKVLGDPLFLAAVAKSVAYAFAISALQLTLGLGIALLFASLVKAGASSSASSCCR